MKYEEIPPSSLQLLSEQAFRLCPFPKPGLRRLAPYLIAFLLFTFSLSWSQESPTLQGNGEGAKKTTPPILRPVPFSAALEVARQVNATAGQGYLAEAFQITVAVGATLRSSEVATSLRSTSQVEKISAAQALGLLAAAAMFAQQPSALPLFPAETRPPAALPVNGDSRTTPLLVPTSALLAEGRPVLDFTYTLGGFPSGVWIRGERVSAAEFMVGVAAALQFLADSGRLPDKVRIVPCVAPEAWRSIHPSGTGTKPKVPVPSSNPARSSPTAREGSIEGEEPTSSPAPLRGKTSLFLFPGDGAEITGEGNIVATLEPADTAATLTFSLDGKVRTISNWPPFAFHVDSSKLGEGRHRLLARAEDAAGYLLASEEISFSVAPEQR